jgi:hypothetical protein
MDEMRLDVENKHNYDIPNRLNHGTALVPSHEEETLVQS